MLTTTRASHQQVQTTASKLDWSAEDKTE